MATTDMQQTSEIEAALERLFHHTLEVMCFTEAERLPSLPAMGDAIEASVAFGGSRTGHLQLQVEPVAARSLTAAFLGLEAGHPSLASHTADTMGEFARILCGRLVTSLDPSTPVEMKPAAIGIRKPEKIIGQAFRAGAGTLCITVQMS